MDSTIPMRCDAMRRDDDGGGDSRRLPLFLLSAQNYFAKRERESDREKERERCLRVSLLFVLSSQTLPDSAV